MSMEERVAVDLIARVILNTYLKDQAFLYQEQLSSNLEWGHLSTKLNCKQVTWFSLQLMLKERPMSAFILAEEVLFMRPIVA